WQDFGMELVDVERGGDARRTAAVVAGDEYAPDAHFLEAGDNFACGRLHGVAKGDQCEGRGRRVEAHQTRNRIAFRFELAGTGVKLIRQDDAGFLQPAAASDGERAAVNMRFDA